SSYMRPHARELPRRGSARAHRGAAPPAIGRRNASSLRPLLGVSLFGAAKAFRHELLRVFGRDAEVIGELDDRHALEISETEDFLVSGWKPLQRFARGQLVRQRVDDVHRRRIDPLDRIVFTLADVAAARAPVITTGVTDRADEPRMQIADLARRLLQVGEEDLMRER